MDDSPGPPSKVSGAELAADLSDEHAPTVAGVTEADRDDPTGRLAAYLARTQNILDVLALCTLWIVIVPVADFANDRGLRDYGLTVRLALSFIYAVDMTIRTRLAARHWHYVRTHPLGVLAVFFPPVRVLFSLRLIRQLFRRGNLPRFLLAALFLLVNGALMVFLYEREAPGANITTLGASLWWSIVTVTTVGYGDYFPVTIQGRVVASFIMFIGIVTVAVITAQVASTFVDQSAKRAADAARGPSPAPAAAASAAAPTPAGGAAAVEASITTGAVTLEDLEARLAHLEELLVNLQPPAPGGSGSSPTA